MVKTMKFCEGFLLICAEKAWHKVTSSFKGNNMVDAIASEGWISLQEPIWFKKNA